MYTEVKKPSVVILGKIPPPFYGPAIATEIILNSSLKEEFNLIHIDTRLNSSIGTMGKMSFRKMIMSLNIYIRLSKSLSCSDIKIVLVPIAQETSALLKDSLFVLISRIFDKKVILHLRGSALLEWYNRSNIFIRRYFIRIFSLCSGAIVLGNNLRYIFEPFFTSDKIFVVPNGGDYKFPPRNSIKSVVTILYFANLYPGKGIDDVLHALGILSIEDKNKIIFEVVGDWSDPDFEAKCRDFAIRLNLPVNFHKPKFGEDKFQFFSDADIFTFPPRAPEGHPWVIVEALAAGLPIISTNQGAIVESVRDGINGYIVDSGRPEKMSEKLAFLINHAEIRKKMGEESLKLYKDNFSEDRMSQRLSAVFHEIIGFSG